MTHYRFSFYLFETTWCDFESTLFNFETQRVVSILSTHFFSSINNSPLPLLCTTSNHYSIVSATTGCPAAMTDNNDPEHTVMVSVHCGDGPMSFVAEAPLTVISLTGYNNTATAAFAIATTTGPAATHVAATLAASKIAIATQKHVPAALTASEAMLAAMSSEATLAEAPLTVIYPTRHNNTAIAAFAIATTTEPAATHVAATLAASKIVNATQTHVPAALTASEAMLAAMASEATLAAMTAASEMSNAPFDTAPPLNVATSSASFPPNTNCLNEEDFVASLLSSGAVENNENTTPAVGSEKTGVASSAGGLDEDTPKDASAKQDMELHYYRSHKASFNMQAFPPGMVTASNTKFKPKIQIDCIRNVVHTWHEYSYRAKNQTLSEEEKKAFTHFKQANKPGNKWIKQYKTFELNVNGTIKVIFRCMELQKDENGDEKMLLGREVISQEEVFDAINDIHRSTGHVGMERTHTHCADKYFSITQNMVYKYCRTCHVCIEANPVIAPHRGVKKPIYSDNWRDHF
jgi:hypothetical protein